MEYAIAFVMGAALGFIGGVLYVEMVRRSVHRIEERFHGSPAPSEMFKEDGQ
ncbi:MAG: hypothetical protein ACREQF_02245 [Candidatus Binataceae bacterium]